MSTGARLQQPFEQSERVQSVLNSLTPLLPPFSVHVYSRMHMKIIVDIGGYFRLF